MESIFCVLVSGLLLSSGYQVGLTDIDYLATSWLGGYLPFNLFDGKTNTCWAEGVSGDGSGTNGYMEWYNGVVRNRNGVGEQILVSFDRKIAVDKITIYNGYMKNGEVWLRNRRVKRISIHTAIPLKPLPANYQELSEKEYYKYFRYFSYEFTIPDIRQVFEIDLSKYQLTNVSWFRFTILSTYPGTTYDDTCISEIEFWYRGQKYEVANLEEAKREFVRKVRENARWGVGEPYDTETYIAESGPEVEKRLAAYGITNVEVLDQTGKMETVGRLASVVRVRKWVPEEGKGYRMVLYAQKKGTGLKKRKVVRRSEEGDDEYELREVVKIGEAKVDENGTTWAKLGNSEWRAVVIRSGYGRMLMSDYFETFGIGRVAGEGRVAPFPEDE